MRVVLHAAMVLSLGLGTAAGAYAEPYAGADLGNGKALHYSKRCASCHTEQTGRDESFIYLRDDRKVKTLFDLRRYVSLCNMGQNLQLFPEEERDVAAYLNAQYYKFKE